MSRWRDIPEKQVTVPSFPSFLAVRKVTSTGDCIKAMVVPAASRLVLQPLADKDAVRKNLSGEITLWLDHSECEKVVISYEALPEFVVVPASITMVNVEPGRQQERQFEVSNNYGETFEIDEVSSEKGHVSVGAAEKTGNGYRFHAKVTPPARATGGDEFRDRVILRLKDGRHIEVDCIGFYSDTRH